MKTDYRFPILILVLLVTLVGGQPGAAISTTANQAPTLPDKDRVRLREAFRLADELGDQVWPGWSKAPFAVLLVTPEYEFLLRHPQPSADFTKIGYDAKLKSDVYYRRRTMPPSFLATFPAIRGNVTSTIVVGQAENTWVKTSTPWVLTLLHEHFHQLQDSQPNFYPDVNALGLTGGDQTGMWMLNYPFPYERQDVQEQFGRVSQLLADVVSSPKSERTKRVKLYRAARAEFNRLVSADDRKYLEFQLWKEGIARYTEFRLAQLATRRFQPSQEFRSLPDYRSFADFARTTYEGILNQLQSQKLGEAKRDVVYSFGAAEGLLLDRLKPNWRRRYFVEKFDLGRL